MSTQRLPPIKTINTDDAIGLPNSVVQLFITTLEDCFNKERTLVVSPFYLFLKTGVTQIAENGTRNDVKLTRLVNFYQKLDKRAVLQRLFHSLANGEYYKNNPTITREEEQQEEGEPAFTGYVEVISGIDGLQLEDLGPSLGELDEIFPRLEECSFDTEFLQSVTGGRYKLLDEYFDEVAHSKRRFGHRRLKFRYNVERLRRKLKHVNNQTNTLVSFAIQSHERFQNKITEVGISIYDPAKDAISLHPSFRTIHILIQENLHLRNGGYVDDQKDKFLGGDSIILPQSEATELIQCIVDYYFIKRHETRGLGAVFVGHNFPRMIKHLGSLGIALPRTTLLIDTRSIYGITHGKDKASLGNLLRRFDIPHLYLNNAGNDAMYTLELLMKMADPQFRRWKGIDLASEFFEAKKARNGRTKREQLDVFQGSEPSAPSAERRHVVQHGETVAPIAFKGWVSALKYAFEHPRGFQ